MIDLASITTLALDLDGCLTSGHVYVLDGGGEALRFSRRDGYGLAMLKAAGIRVLVISRQQSEAAELRCATLGLEHVGDVEDKAAELRRRVEDLATCCYVGDDLPDLPCLEIVGVPCCPHDAVHTVIDAVTERGGAWLNRRGGDHCVREIADMIIAARVAK